MSSNSHFHHYVLIKSHTAIKMLPHAHIHFAAASINSQNQLSKLQLTTNK